MLVIAIAASAAEPKRLPTGATLDPYAPAFRLGSHPLALVAAPEGDRLVALLNGWREQGIQVIDSKSGGVLQTIEQKAAFLGLVFSSDGKTLYASGGDEDIVYVYKWEDGRAVADGSITILTKAKPTDGGRAYPSGLAVSPDGALLYVAENLGDAVSVFDTKTRSFIRRMRTDKYPYAVIATKDALYVSCWGDDTINVFRGTKKTRIEVARHPSAMLLHNNRIYVTSATTDTIAVVSTVTNNVIARMSDPPPAGPREGSTPNALAVSRDGKRLFVAEADNNAVAVFEIATRKMIGRIPTEWYPSALARSGNPIFVANAKGEGTGPNPDLPPLGNLRRQRPNAYTLGQLSGSLMSFADTIDAAPLTKRVAVANGWTAAKTAPKYPPFKHVIYIVKENRTYDQVFGDVPEGDGDPALVYFDVKSTPNHREIAKRFGLFDRFFVNAEVSATGHNWSTGAYSSDYVEKTVPTQYSGRGRDYDYEGANRKEIVDDDDDVASPMNGYLWNAALKKKLTLRNYGEFVVEGGYAGRPEKHVATKKALVAHTATDYSGYNLSVTDQSRVDIWLREFNQYVANGNLPALEIMRLPNDHTSGAAAGKPAPRAYMADNDLALGRIVEAVSKSQYWRDTVFFVLEDDAQAGPDHVDSHRSILLVISAWNKGGTINRFVNTTDVLATIEEILGLEAMSQFDHYGRPLRNVFGSEPDLRPYSALVPDTDLNEKNPPSQAAKETLELDLSRADAADDDKFNRILWKTIKGDLPYPAPRRAPLSETLGSFVD